MINDFTKVSHWTQVVLIVQDADGSAISGQDLDLGIAIVRVSRSSGDASFELEFAIHGNAYPSLFPGDEDNLYWPMISCW